MRFSIKIFISTFLVVLMSLCIGETVVISISYRREIQSEIEKVKNENLMMRMGIATLIKNYNKSMYRDEADALSYVFEVLKANWENETIQFRILNHKKEVIEDNFYVTSNFNNFPENEETLTYKITKIEDQYYLTMCTRLNLTEDIFIMNMQDISNTINERNELLRVVFMVDLCIGIIGAILNWIIVYRISNPIKEMTVATKRIKEGSMGVKIRTHNKDELGVLAECFNAMIESLEEKMEQLEDAARRQEDFVASFAHEIKTPLTSIIGYADLIRSKKLDLDTTNLASNYIFTEGKRLENISIKLLELIVEKNTKLQKDTIAVQTLLQDVLEVLKPSFLEKSIQVNMNVDCFMIYVDIELMKTVLINILDNARKAVEHNGTISIHAHLFGDEVVIEVIDDGRGIPKEDLDKIKEAFYRVDKSRARVEGGAGLGLSICTQIMELHGGEILFESELNKGTTVSLRWRCSVENES